MGSLDNEQKIVDQFANGSTEAFRLLYESYAPRLKAYCMRFQSDTISCDDIVQETFKKIWEKRATIHKLPNFNAYIITIAKHLIYNQIRHEVYVKKHASEYKNTVRSTYQTENILDIKMLLNKAIPKLPERCREIYKLSRIEGYSNAEIAEKLNLSVSTVENQINKALKVIKADLRKAGYYLLLFLLFYL